MRPPAIKVKFFNLADQIMEELGFSEDRDAVSGFSIFLLPSVLEKGIKLMRSVDWHENQGQRGWNYGMHKFYLK